MTMPTHIPTDSTLAVSESVSTSTPPPGRNPDGTFARGNAIGKGNPNAQHINRLRQTFITEGLRIVEGDGPEESRMRMARVVTKMFSLAEGGDVHAARFCAEYSIGKPQTVITVEDDAGPRFKVFMGIDEGAI